MEERQLAQLAQKIETCRDKKLVAVMERVYQDQLAKKEKQQKENYEER